MYLLYMSDHEYRTPLSTAREMTPLTPNIVGKYMRLTQGNWHQASNGYRCTLNKCIAICHEASRVDPIFDTI